MRASTGWLTPMRVATTAWVRPASFRAVLFYALIGHLQFFVGFLRFTDEGVQHRELTLGDDVAQGHHQFRARRHACRLLRRICDGIPNAWGRLWFS